MELWEKTIARDTRFRGRILTLQVDRVELPDGSEAEREVVRHPGGVCIAPLTREGDLLFVRQYRYPYGEVVWELPAGKREAGEDPYTTALRELKEETGATASALLPMGVCYPSPGYTDEVISLYAATDLTLGEANPDADEWLAVERVPLQTAVDWVLGGRITDAKTQILVLKLAAKRAADGQ